jgi:hypothetical protein
MLCRVNLFNRHPDNAAETWIPSRCLTMDARSDSDILAFKRHATTLIAFEVLLGKQDMLLSRIFFIVCQGRT